MCLIDPACVYPTHTVSPQPPPFEGVCLLRRLTHITSNSFNYSISRKVESIVFKSLCSNVHVSRSLYWQEVPARYWVYNVSRACSITPVCAYVDHFTGRSTKRTIGAHSPSSPCAHLARMTGSRSSCGGSLAFRAHKSRSYYLTKHQSGRSLSQRCNFLCLRSHVQPSRRPSQVFLLAQLKRHQLRVFNCLCLWPIAVKPPRIPPVASVCLYVHLCSFYISTRVNVSFDSDPAVALMANKWPPRNHWL